jgi:GAF domain-containing protein
MAQQPTQFHAALAQFHAALADLGRIKFNETDLDAVVARVAHLAGRTVPGVGEVSLTLVRDGRAYTAATTGDMALQLDEWQYAAGDGPCLRAAADETTVSITDLSADTRWPDWARRAEAAGAGSSLSVGLPILDDVAGSLNLYGGTRRAFDTDAVEIAQTFAGYAAIALANAHLYETTTNLARHMQSAMESRAVIEQAKGIIMGERRCTPDQAFKILTEVSQSSNRKLRHVATALVQRTQAPALRNDT